MNPTQEFNTALSALSPSEQATYRAKNPTIKIGDTTYSDSSTGYTPINTGISGANLAPTSDFKVNPVMPSTAYTGLGESIGQMTNTFAENQAKQAESLRQQQELQAKEQATQKSKTSLIDKLLGRSTETQLINQQYQDTGVDKARAELNDINNQIIAEQVGLRRRVEAIDKNFQGTVQGKADEIDRITRESTSKQADLAVIQLAKQNNYSAAKEIADRAIQAQLEKQQKEIEAYKLDYQDNKELFTKAEQRQYEAEIKKKDRELAKEDERLTLISNLSLEALKAGAPANIVAQMRKASTVEDALRIGGIYIGSSERQKKQLENLKLSYEIENLKPVTGEWASVVNQASSIVPGTLKSDYKKNIGYALAQEDWNGAYKNVGNAVSESLTGTNKTRFDNTRTDVGVMSRFRQAIQEYADAGGDLGLLAGTEEEIKRKLGIDSGRATQLATALWREFQVYRNDMTGAAFGANESRDYASVNPTLGKSLNLNLSVIDGALMQLNNRIDATIDGKISGADKIRQKIAETVPPNIKVQSFYQKAGQDIQNKIDQMIRENVTWEEISKAFSL